MPLSTGSAVWIKPRLSFYTPTKNNTRTTNSILHSRFFFPQDGQFRDPWFSLLLKRGLRGGQRPGGVCSSGHRCHAEVGRHRLAEEHSTSLPVVVKGVLTGELFIESVRKVFSLSLELPLLPVPLKIKVLLRFITFMMLHNRRLRSDYNVWSLN